MIAIIATLTACIIFPVSLLFIFKTNGGILFLASCAGIVLLQSLDPAVVTTASAVIPGDGEAIIRLLVVAMSVIFASMMFRQSISNAQLGLHILVGAIVGVMLWLLLPETTGFAPLLTIEKESLWKQVNEFRTLIIATGFSISLLTILVSKPPKHEKGKHH